MSRYEKKSNTRVQQLFEDLEKYKRFCVEYGYRYDEVDLYKDRSYVWRQYTKYVTGKPVKNQWDEMLKASE